MRFLNTVLLSLAFLTTTPFTLALPVALDPSLSPTSSPSNPVLDLLLPRQACLDTCGSVCYYSSTVANAQNKGYSLYSSGSNINSYPHVFNNREGFFFPISAPYYEYPILRTFKVYTGGSPGADRVIFNGQNQYGGLITHEGASTSGGFVECR